MEFRSKKERPKCFGKYKNFLKIPECDTCDIDLLGDCQDHIYWYDRELPEDVSKEWDGSSFQEYWDSLRHIVLE